MRSWSGTQRDAVAAVLQDAVRGWEQDWGLPASEAAVRCVAASAQEQDGTWQGLGTRGAAMAWVERLDSFDVLLARALWDADHVDAPIAVAVQASCARDGLARLAAALRLGSVTSGQMQSGPQCGPWSGALCAILPWNTRVLLNADAIEAPAASNVPAGAPTKAAPSPLVPLKHALDQHAMPLRVHLADCEIAVGSLRDLQPGDVLRLDHPLHAPLQVRDRVGHALFDASLARCGGFKAAQLTARRPAPPPTGKAVP